MRDIGNTLIVVEHDEETMLNADYIVDIGPGPGEHGGEVVFAGHAGRDNDGRKVHNGQISFRQGIYRRACKAAGNRRKLAANTRARANNLKNVNVDIPAWRVHMRNGSTGSGKSSLVNEVLKKRC